MRFAVKRPQAFASLTFSAFTIDLFCLGVIACGLPGRLRGMGLPRLLKSLVACLHTVDTLTPSNFLHMSGRHLLFSVPGRI